jgi:hypothetical protein
MPSKTAPAPKAAAAAGLRVVSKSPRGAFRRCGFVFGPQAAVVPLSLLTAEQIERIRSEPMLDVTDVPDVDAEPAPAAEA